MKLRVVLLALVLGISSVQAEDAPQDDAISGIAAFDVPGLHPGPYSKLSPADRTENTKSVMSFCLIACVSNYGMLSTREEPLFRLNAEYKLCIDACVLAHIPPDNPVYPTFAAKVRQELKDAKDAGSTTMLKGPD